MRAQVDASAAAVLACTTNASITIGASWSALGSVTIEVDGASPDVVDCIRAAVGQVICPVGAPAGRAVRTLAR